MSLTIHKRTLYDPSFKEVPETAFEVVVDEKKSITLGEYSLQSEDEDTCEITMKSDKKITLKFVKLDKNTIIIKPLNGTKDSHVGSHTV